MCENRVTGTVVSAVAAEKGVPVDALPQFHDSIDPDALDGLINHSNTTTDTELLVQFSYAECMVTVSPRGDVSVEI